MAISYATFVQGRALMQDYTPGSPVSAGDVIVVNTPRIAHLDIAAGETGSIAFHGGVYVFPKATSGGSAIGDNVLVYWDATAKVITTTATANKRLGYTFGASADGDATQKVCHSVG